MNEADRIFFDMCVVSILSFQFHPGNDSSRLPNDEVVQRAIDVALIALRARARVLYLGEL